MDLGTMNVLGLGSGMDLQGLIDKLINVDKQPILMKQSQKVEYESYYQTFDSLESKMTKLAMDTSTMLTDLNAQSASVSDDSLADVSVVGAPTNGIHNITVDTLAQGQTWLSTTSESSLTNSIVSSGSGSFTYKIGDKEYTINLDNNSLTSTPTTLQEFINAINSNGSGLQATTINNGSGYVVVLKTPEGTNNDLTIVQNDTDLTFGDNGAPNVASSDASLTIDGVSITSHSNTLDDNIPGLEIKLKKTGSFSVYVNTNYSEITKDMQNIVDDYNDMMDFIAKNSGYDDEKNVADAFFTNSTIQGVKTTLQNILMDKYGGSNSSISYLSDLGIDIDKTGKMSLDTEKFQQALQTNFKDVKKVLDESSTGADDGFLNRLHSALNNMTSTNGSIELEKNYLQGKTERLQEQINAMNKQLEQERVNLTLTFSQMDEYIGMLKSQSSYMTQVFDSLDNSKNK